MTIPISSGMRRLRLGLSCLFAAAGAIVVGTFRNQSEEDRSYTLLAFPLLFVIAAKIHPGSLGNSEVPEADQRSLVRGMMHECFGTASNRRWTLARGVASSGIVLVDFWAHGHTNRYQKIMSVVNMGASRFGMVAYAADRAWGYVRVHRVEPDAQGRNIAAAWMMNLLTGLAFDLSAVMFNQGIKHLVQHMLSMFDQHPKNGIPDADPNNDYWLQTVVPMVLGTFASHLVNEAVMQTSGRTSATARILSHLARLAARLGGRMFYTKDGIFLAIELGKDFLAAAPMHRWGVTPPNTVRQGLTIAREAKASQHYGKTNVGEVRHADFKNPDWSSSEEKSNNSSRSSFRSSPSISVSTINDPRQIQDSPQSSAKFEMRIMWHCAPDTPSQQLSSATTLASAHPTRTMSSSSANGRALGHGSNTSPPKGYKKPDGGGADDIV